MSDFYRDKDVLVTGGAGSIGSALVDELLARGARKVRSFDNSEAGQFDLAQRHYGNPAIRLLMGDVRDKQRLHWAFEGVDAVFHAAALKHVPLCEYNPAEAVKTNVMGSLNVINAARSSGVGRCVLISTDKAVNPVNAMGASKMMAEKLFLDAAIASDEILFSCVRFGNVLGSVGSVAQVFRDQVTAGGPVTVTSSEMTRFIMSIRDAVGLVLQAAEQSEGREVFILKMKALTIPDLARACIEHFAPLHTVDPASIEIVETGIRSGEKLSEQLLSAEELPRTVDGPDYFVYRPPVVLPHATSDVVEGGGIDIAEYDSASAPKMPVPEIVELLRSAGGV